MSGSCMRGARAHPPGNRSPAMLARKPTRRRLQLVRALDEWDEDESNARMVERLVVNDLVYLDNRAKEDSELAAESLSRVARWLKGEPNEEQVLEGEMERLKDELKEAQTAMYLNEARLERSLRRLSQLEGDASEKASHPYPRQLISPSTPDKLSERECWIPVAFSRDLQSETLIPFELEGNPWVLFRSASGRPGCIYDECAHRACPLSLGQVKEGRLQCAYHGWEFSIKGECEKMPSCQFRKDVFVRSLPAVENDGMVFVWPGEELPSESVPSYEPPAGYQTVAELAMEVDVAHGAFLENLVQCRNQSFKTVSERRKRNTGANNAQLWEVIKFPTQVVRIFRGSLHPFPRDVNFSPPVTVTTNLALAKIASPTEANRECHAHQTYTCLPGSNGRTRVLYRLSIDFVPPGRRNIPKLDPIWIEFGRQVVEEETRRVKEYINGEQ